MDILIVEDDRDVREAICELLELEGHHTIQAASGEEALDLLRRGGLGIELVLLDLVMPGMDGWELAQRIGAGEIPIVVTSGARELTPPPNATAALSKPFGIADLMAIIDRCAGERRTGVGPRPDIDAPPAAAVA